MKRVNIQFHATYADFLGFIMEMKKNKYKISGVVLFPQFKIIKITEGLKALDIKEIDMIIISKSDIQQADSYSSFIKMQDNNLVINVGKESDDKLYESSMGIWSESEINTDLKRIINSFKKKMNKGAWIINPYSNSKDYYKNHMYTNNARLAFENGVQICPMAGWNLYELTNDSLK